MENYKFRGRNRSGKIVEGTLKAKSVAAARNSVVNKGLSPLSVAKVQSLKDKTLGSGISRYIYKDDDGTIQLSLGSGYPTAKELGLFTKQFSLMIENGVNIVSALKLLQRGQKKRTFRNIIMAAADDIEKGSTLQDALAAYPQVFDNLYLAMIAAGEKSGKLDIIMRQLVIYIEKSIKIKSQVKSAMTYPSMILIVAISVVSLLLAFVVPSFAKQFESTGQKLPELTQLVIDMSNGLMDNWLFIVGAIGLFVGISKQTLKTSKGRLILDKFLLTAPILGDVMTKISVGRFCSTMSTMLGAGVSILDSLKICAQASGNQVVETFVYTVRDTIEKGGSFFKPLEQSPLFPPLVSSMVEVGEATGKLDDTLSKITEIYDQEVDTAIEAMTAMIEPIMIVGIGGIVGFIVLAMYLPVFDMANTAG